MRVFLYMTQVAEKTFDVKGWMARQNQPTVLARTLKVVAALKEQGVVALGATGYCYGGRICMDLAFENLTKVIVISHPTFLQVPEDFEVCSIQPSTILRSQPGYEETQGPIKQPSLD
jgi:dienelactone hydrolase